MSVFFLNSVLPTYAYFASGKVSLTGINLGTKETWADSDPPESSTEILPNSLSQLNFNINFSANDIQSNVVEVKLYYSRSSLGDWLEYGTQAFSGSKSVSGSFSFNSPLGEGYYRFLTVAKDSLNNLEYDLDKNETIEEDESYSVPANTWTVMDTAVPVTTLSVNQPLAVVNEQIYNGGFENGNLDSWTIAGDGDHQATQAAIKTGSWSAFLGNAASDSISKTVSLSSDIVSNLSFWYRLLTSDNVSGGFFDATIKKGTEEVKVVHDGWDDPTISETDLGWKNVVYQLNNLVGQNVDLEFKVSQPNDGYQTWVYLDEVRLTAATNSAIVSSEINLSSHDASGSGVTEILYQIDNGTIATYSAPLTLDSGTHSLTYFAKDEAGNNEAIKSMTINATDSAGLDFGIVLNEFLPNPTGDDYAPAPNGEWVELYNNSPMNIDLNGWKLKDNLSHELIIDVSKTEGEGTIIASGGKLRIYRRGSGETSGSNFLMNNDNDTVNLLKPDNTLVDFFAYSFSAEGKSFKRSPDGIGTWKDPEVEIDDENTVASESGQTTITASPSASVQPSPVILPEPITTLSTIPLATPESTLTPSVTPSAVPVSLSTPTPEATSQPVATQN